MGPGRAFAAFSLSAIIALAPSRALADNQHALVGLKSFYIVIEGVDSDAVRCGVTLPILYTSLRFVLGQSRIQVVDNTVPNDGYIYLNVLASRQCLFRLDLEVNASVTIIESRRFAIAAIWRVGGIVDSGHLTNQVEQYTKQLVNDWNEDNHP